MRIKLFITCVIISVFLSGCTHNNPKPTRIPSGITPASSTSATSKAPYSDTIQESTSQAETASTESITEPDTDLVVYEENGLKITAIGLEQGNIGNLKLTLLIENDSDKDLTIQSENTSINGYMIHSMMSANVLSGKKINTSMDFWNDDLTELGIEEICDICFSFYIFNQNDWSDNYTTEWIDLVTNSTYTQQYDDSGVILYNENDIKIVFKGVAPDYLGQNVLLYVENNSEKDITINARDTSINGYMIMGTCSIDVSSGKKALDSISFFSSTLADNSITDIYNVELYFHIYNSDDWQDYINTDIINISID